MLAAMALRPKGSHSRSHSATMRRVFCGAIGMLAMTPVLHAYTAILMDLGARFDEALQVGPTVAPTLFLPTAALPLSKGKAASSTAFAPSLPALRFQSDKQAQESWHDLSKRIDELLLGSVDSDAAALALDFTPGRNVGSDLRHYVSLQLSGTGQLSPPLLYRNRHPHNGGRVASAAAQSYRPSAVP